MELLHEDFPLKETFQKGKFRGRVLKKGARADNSHYQWCNVEKTVDNVLIYAQ